MPDVESRPRTFFPSQINTYRQCPRRYYLQYILKRKRTLPFSPALVKGGATHRLIARSLPHFLRNGALPSDLRARAREEVESCNYPENERNQLERDAFEVTKWTIGALEMMPPRSRPVLQERNLYAPIGKRGIQLGARVDLVLRHDEMTGPSSTSTSRPARCGPTPFRI